MCSWKLPYFNYNVEFPTLFVGWLSNAKYMGNLCASATQFQLEFPDISILPALAVSTMPTTLFALQYSYLF